MAGNNIYSKFTEGITKDGVVTTAFRTITYVQRKINSTIFIRTRMGAHLKKSQLAIRDGLSVQELKLTTLEYVESMRIKESGPYGRYRYCESQRTPLLYASVFAALTRSIYGDLDTLTAAHRLEWVAYIKSFQGTDGLFRDPEVDCELASTVMWWGWEHLTFLTLMALTCLDAKIKVNLPDLTIFKDKASIHDLFLSLKISRTPNPNISAHAPCYYISYLQYARDFLGCKLADMAICEFINLLNSEIDPATGCWGTQGYENNKYFLNEGVKIGFHFWIFYFYDSIPIPYADKVVDSLLLTQNAVGGFDTTLNSSACDDIDSIHPLCKLLIEENYRREDIQRALGLAVPWVLANRNSDGGFVFKRDEPFQYGHKKMLSGRNESHMFATWFRTLSLAYVGKALPNNFLANYDWHLPKIPGLQSW